MPTQNKTFANTEQAVILALNLIALVAFAAFYIHQKNYEFVLYIGVIAFFLTLIIVTNAKVQYPNPVLWGLSLWSLMHLAGGSVPAGDSVLYGVILIPLSDTYHIFRYDQLVHIVGFGVSTLLVHHLLTPHLRPDAKHGVALGIVVVMGGLGVGALNEIVEFAAVVMVPETGVGGYTNTALDLVADLLGALLAWVYIRVRAASNASRTARSGE